MSTLSAEERQHVRAAIDEAKRAQIKPRSSGARPSGGGAKSLVKELVVEREPRIYGHCPLCGCPCRGTACPEHSDLLRAEQRLLRRRAA